MGKRENISVSKIIYSKNFSLGAIVIGNQIPQVRPALPLKADNIATYFYVPMPRDIDNNRMVVLLDKRNPSRIFGVVHGFYLHWEMIINYCRSVRL